MNIPNTNKSEEINNKLLLNIRCFKLSPNLRFVEKA